MRHVWLPGCVLWGLVLHGLPLSGLLPSSLQRAKSQPSERAEPQMTLVVAARITDSDVPPVFSKCENTIGKVSSALIHTAGVWRSYDPRDGGLTYHGDGRRPQLPLSGTSVGCFISVSLLERAAQHRQQQL